MGVETNRALVARRQETSRHIERAVREAQRRSPEVAGRRARIGAATRAGRAAVKSRHQAQSRLITALRRLIADGLSIRDASERLGLPYHEARQLIRAAEVAERTATPPKVSPSAPTSETPMPPGPPGCG